MSILHSYAKLYTMQVYKLLKGAPALTRDKKRTKNSESTGHAVNAKRYANAGV